MQIQVLATPKFTSCKLSETITFSYRDVRWRLWTSLSVFSFQDLINFWSTFSVHICPTVFKYPQLCVHQAILSSCAASLNFSPWLYIYPSKVIFDSVTYSSLFTFWLFFLSSLEHFSQLPLPTLMLSLCLFSKSWFKMFI